MHVPIHLVYFLEKGFRASRRLAQWIILAYVAAVTQIDKRENLNLYRNNKYFIIY